MSSISENDSYNRSEGFSRTGYLVPGRDGLGVPPDAQGSWDAAAAAVAAVAVPPTGARPAPPATPAPAPPATPRRPPADRMQFI